MKAGRLPFYFSLLLAAIPLMAGSSKVYKGSCHWNAEKGLLPFYLVLEDPSRSEGEAALYFPVDTANARWEKATGTFSISYGEMEVRTGNVEYRGTFAAARSSVSGEMTKGYASGSWSAGAVAGEIGDYIKSDSIGSWRGNIWSADPLLQIGYLIHPDGGLYQRISASILFRKEEWAFNPEVMSITEVYKDPRRSSERYYSINPVPQVAGAIMLWIGGKNSNIEVHLRNILFEGKKAPALSYIGTALMAIPSLLNTNFEVFPGGQSVFSMHAGTDFDWFHINPFDKLNRFGMNAGLSLYIWRIVLTGDVHLHLPSSIMADEYSERVFGFSIGYMATR